MNKMMIIGNLGSDARFVAAQNPFVSFPVAEAGEDNPTWVECTMSVKGPDDKRIGFLTKGKQVYVEGRPHVGAYKDEKGEARGQLKMYVTTLQFLGPVIAKEK